LVAQRVGVFICASEAASSSSPPAHSAVPMPAAATNPPTTKDAGPAPRVAFHRSDAAIATAETVRV